MDFNNKKTTTTKTNFITFNKGVNFLKETFNFKFWTKKQRMTKSQVIKEQVNKLQDKQWSNNKRLSESEDLTNGRRIYSYVITFVWIQYRIWFVANSGLAFWNISGFSFPSS